MWARIPENEQKEVSIAQWKPELLKQWQGALDLYARGLDFADAMYLTHSNADSFATFDETLRKRARSIGGLMPVIAP